MKNFKLIFKDQVNDLKSGASPRGLRFGGNRPEKIEIKIDEEFNSVGLSRLIKYLNTLWNALSIEFVEDNPPRSNMKILKKLIIDELCKYEIYSHSMYDSKEIIAEQIIQKYRESKKTKSEKEHIEKVFTEAKNKNIDIEIFSASMMALKENPSLSISEAINEGLKKWG